MSPPGWKVSNMILGKNEGQLLTGSERMKPLIKEEMARLNICFLVDVSEHYMLGISELKWMEMGEFNSHNNSIYYCGQKSHRRNGVAFIINKRV